MYIACPKCDWRPGAGDLWQCVCSHTWNTFQTRGVCPACGKIWRQTQCLACHQWSEHEDWYRGDDGVVIEKYVVEPERTEEPV